VPRGLMYSFQVFSLLPRGHTCFFSSDGTSRSISSRIVRSIAGSQFAAVQKASSLRPSEVLLCTTVLIGQRSQLHRLACGLLFHDEPPTHFFTGEAVKAGGFQRNEVAAFASRANHARTSKNRKHPKPSYAILNRVTHKLFRVTSPLTAVDNVDLLRYAGMK